jgi:hypothetical protein
MVRYTILALAFLVGGTASAGNQSLDAAVGGALGGGLGALVGNEVGGRTGAIVGGGLGAAAGAAIATDRDPGPRYVSPPYYSDPPSKRWYGPGRKGCPPGLAMQGRCR